MDIRLLRGAAPEVALTSDVVGPEAGAATSFDAVGDLYDRYRPPYPEALIADLLSLAGIGPDSRILEIGSGTGIATLPLARRGHSILCLEPGPQLAAIARRKLAEFERVVVVETTFEAWDAEPAAFDLVFSAQAFHWLDPETRFQKAAFVLDPRGFLAVFGHAQRFEDSPLQRALAAVYARHAPGLNGAAPMQWYGRGGPVPDLFASSRLFEAVESRHHPGSRRYPTQDYVNLLRTFSDHNVLPEPRKTALLDAIAREIDRFGGEIEIAYESHLYIARRAE